MPRYRKLAKQVHSPEKKEFVFQTGAKNPLPKPDEAKLKRRKPKIRASIVG